ncbi:hypothetical protein KAR91_69190 [Candidatus Pacearchaeota archaeon]|nr:hypothetical protein [Candidatus Pacearchaeota archaeon]
MDVANKRAYNKKWAQNNKDKIRSYNKKWRSANSNKIIAYNKRWAKDNPEKVKAKDKAYRKANPEKYREYAMRRIAAKEQRTVKWGCEEVIKRCYEYAVLMEEITGEKWHVDHIIPLRGAQVNGLHVHNNLQIIRASENRVKGNKFVR